MDSATETLVIINSVVLIVFLIVGIIAGVKLISLLNEVKRITDKVEAITDSIQQAASAFEKAALPAAAVKAFGSFINQAKKAKKKEK